MAEERTGLQINPYAVIGEKQVRLEFLAQYAQGLEQQVREQQATIDTMAAQIAALQAPADTDPDNESADMVAEGSPVG